MCDVADRYPNNFDGTVFETCDQTGEELRSVFAAAQLTNSKAQMLTDAFVNSVLDQVNEILYAFSVQFGSPGEIRTPVDGSLPG
jgi:hypothetical protein